MTKGKRPHKKDPGGDDDLQPAVGPEAPPEPLQPLLPSPAAPEHGRPTLFSLLQTVRGALGALMGWADAAADVINKTLQRRA